MACIILLGVELRLDIVVASTDFIITMEHDIIINSSVIDSIVSVFICGDGLLSWVFNCNDDVNRSWRRSTFFISIFLIIYLA